MKKLVSIFLVVLLLLTSLFVLTGCNKGGDGNGDSGEAKIDKSVQKYYDNAETGELKDKWNGLDLKFAYPKDKGYEIEFTNKKVEYQKATHKNCAVLAAVPVEGNRSNRHCRSKCRIYAHLYRHNHAC